MSDERAEYLATASGPEPADRERLDQIRQILRREETWAEPPPEVGDRLLAAIRSPATQSDPQFAPRRWGWAVAAISGIAALVIAVAGFLGVFSSPDQVVIAMEGTDLEPSASGRVAIREAEGGWWIELDVEALPAAAEGTYYEGWLWNDEGEGVSIGTFHLRGGDSPVVLWSGVDPAEYPAVWVTLEPEDGDPSASEQIVLKGAPDEG